MDARIQGIGLYKITDEVIAHSDKIIDTVPLSEFQGIEWSIYLKTDSGSKSEMRKIFSIKSSSGIKYSAPVVIGDNINANIEININSEIEFNLINNESELIHITLVRILV